MTSPVVAVGAEALDVLHAAVRLHTTGEFGEIELAFISESYQIITKSLTRTTLESALFMSTQILADLFVKIAANGERTPGEIVDAVFGQLGRDWAKE